MTPETAHCLNRLLAIQCRSFLQYFQYCRPYVPSRRSQVLETIDSIVADQETLAVRISRMLIDADYLPHTGDFPMEFTDMHDLDIDFLINAAANYQSQDVASIDALVDRLRTSPAAKAIAEEALGMAKGHLDALRELLPAKAGA